MFIIIDNYDSFTYNLVHRFGELGAVLDIYRNDAIDTETIMAKSPEAIILSPGPCTPNEAGICLDVIAKAGAHIPILGVCLGHQAIGQVYGGNVVRAPTIMHGKISDIHHQQKSIFRGLASPFEATRYHSLTVDRQSLPECLEITAESDDGLIMGMQHQHFPIHGVQFHPESIATEAGYMLLGNFIRLSHQWNADERDITLFPLK